MDFIFHDDGADIIRRELMAPRVAIVQSLLQTEPSKRSMKMAQICYGTIDDPHSPGNSLGCKKETTRQRPVNIGNGNPAINPHPQGDFEPIDFEDFLNEELTECQAGQIADRNRNEAAKKLAQDIAMKAAADGRSGTDQPEYGATIAMDSNGNAHHGEIAQGESYDEAAPNAPQTQSRRPSGFAWSNVVATVHTHPSSGQTAVDRRNRAPSNGDWLGADEIIKRGVDPNNFTLFVIDKWGKMRAYRYKTPAERNASSKNPSGNQTSINDAVELNDVRECNS